MCSEVANTLDDRSAELDPRYEANEKAPLLVLQRRFVEKAH